MAAQPVMVIIVDPSVTVRRVLIEFLRSVPELTIAGEADSGAEALRLAEELQPGLVLADNALPDLSVNELIQAIKVVSRDTQVIVLSTYDIDIYRETALANGAADFIVKTDLVERLTPVVRTLF